MLLITVSPDCPSYVHERWPMYRHCKTRNPSMKKLLNTKKMLVPVANFIQATGRFEQGGGGRRAGEQEQTQEGRTRNGDEGAGG